MGERPQQEEIARRGFGETTQDGRRITREDEHDPASGGKTGPVPPENQPGHHPEKEQDKPEPRH